MDSNLSKHNIQDNDRWFSVYEIATYLGVSKDTIYSWVNNGLPAYKVSRFWKFKLAEVDHWVRSKKH